MSNRDFLKDKKRIVVKVGSSTITHEATGAMDLLKLERLVRILCDIHNQGKDVILVSSGAIAVGRGALGILERPKEMSVKQACASVGQARLMMTYQKLFGEYNQITSQVLLTKYTMIREDSRDNAQNTFKELLRLGVIPVVNENDTVSTHEIEFGDNDKLSAIVASIADADLLILLSDIDGMFTDDPNKNPDAKFIEEIPELTEDILSMGKGSASSVGTGGMSAKLDAAQIATSAGADMIITNGNDVENLARILQGENVGTIFKAHKNDEFDLSNIL